MKNKIKKEKTCFSLLFLDQKDRHLGEEKKKAKWVFLHPLEASATFPLVCTCTLHAKQEQCFWQRDLTRADDALCSWGEAQGWLHLLLHRHTLEPLQWL